MKWGTKFWLASAAFLPNIAHAQIADNAEQDANPAGDIIVTAQRFEQRLQDVPISITAMTGEEIEARNAKLLEDLQYSVPGLSLFAYGAGATYTQLRGVSNISGAATVGVYYDETPFTLSTVGLDSTPKLLDMERVEVLRGPQAALYGEGSMGGTIRYIPAAPQLDRVSGWATGQASVTKGGDGSYLLEGGVNLPIVTDKVGLRVAASYERVGGWIDRPATGDHDVNSADLYTVRGTLRLKPTERLDISLLGLYQKSNQHNQNFGANGQTIALFDTPLRDETVFVQAKASYDLDFANLTAIGGYIDRDNFNRFDVTPLYLPGLINGEIVMPGDIDNIALDTDTDFKVYNGELRLASQGEGPLSWAFGGTFRHLKQFGTQIADTAPGALPFVFIDVAGFSENKSYAVYGEVGYEFTPGLTATVGARYYIEHKEQTYDNTVFGVPSLDINEDTFRSFNPRFNLSYQFSPDAMVYANVAKGFRSGGFNLLSAAPAAPPSYEPDNIWTYEAGGKVGLADNKLILDASVYRSVWSDVQAPIAAGTFSYIANSGRVTGWGVDFSATARPMRELTLSGTFGWNDLAYRTNSADKQIGDPVDGATRFSYSASFDYRPSIADDVNGIFRIDYQHSGRGQITVRTYTPPLLAVRAKRDLVNIRAGIAIEALELSLFANNLFNEDAPVLIGPYGVVVQNIEQRPRTVGINATMRF
ncbi:TonB-dependent receptor [Sphingopyxis panaciterrae]